MLLVRLMHCKVQMVPLPPHLLQPLLQLQPQAPASRPALQPQAPAPQPPAPALQPGAAAHTSEDGAQLNLVRPHRWLATRTDVYAPRTAAPLCAASVRNPTLLSLSMTSSAQFARTNAL